MVIGFEWDEHKDRLNQRKHGVSFARAQQTFMGPNRVIAIDRKHSTSEETWYFCFGVVDGRILTVRFTYRKGRIRIFGAGCWREGRKRYEQDEI
ncbi:MAG: BrnT family toxin [Gemmatimonadota bacterium]|nr:BrnT family toxin [Gemmatimonadota bacterium]